MSFPEIGRFMGKDHTTVLLACRRIKRMLESGGEARWSTPSGEKVRKAGELVGELESQITRGGGSS